MSKMCESKIQPTKLMVTLLVKMAEGNVLTDLLMSSSSPITFRRLTKKPQDKLDMLAKIFPKY